MSSKNQAEWLEVDQDKLLYLELETARVTILLAESFSPKHVEYIRELVNEGFYDGLPLYRIIENFTVQGEYNQYQRK